jgi:L-aspartate oxidase
MLTALQVTRMRDVMSAAAGGLREGQNMIRALDDLDQLDRDGLPGAALANRLATMRLVIFAALMRRESRGAHARRDYPALAETATRTYLRLSDVMRAGAAPRIAGAGA